MLTWKPIGRPKQHYTNTSLLTCNNLWYWIRPDTQMMDAW